MTAQPGPRRVKRRWPVLAGAVAVALLVGVAAFAIAGPGRSGGQPTPAGSPTPPVTSVPVETPAETPVEAPSATPSSTATPKEQTPYCKAVANIRSGGLEASNNEGNLDFEALSKNFAELIKLYSAAAEHAPAELAGEYRTALNYLKEMKAAVDSRDLEGIKKMVRNLSSLNDTMATIQTESERLCG